MLATALTTSLGMISACHRLWHNPVCISLLSGPNLMLIGDTRVETGGGGYQATVLVHRSPTKISGYSSQNVRYASLNYDGTYTLVSEMMSLSHSSLFHPQTSTQQPATLSSKSLLAGHNHCLTTRLELFVSLAALVLVSSQAASSGHAVAAHCTCQAGRQAGPISRTSTCPGRLPAAWLHPAFPETSSLREQTPLESL
jgi:hypothetical protein